MARRRSQIRKRNKINRLFVSHAVLALGSGLAFTLAPAPLLQLLGLTVQPGAVLVAELFGVSNMGAGLLVWLTRNAAESEVLRAQSISFLITLSIGFFVTFLAQTTGVMNTLGWLIVAAYLGLALGYGYRLLRRRVFR